MCDVALQKQNDTNPEILKTLDYPTAALLQSAFNITTGLWLKYKNRPSVHTHEPLRCGDVPQLIKIKKTYMNIIHLIHFVSVSWNTVKS